MAGVTCHASDAYIAQAIDLTWCRVGIDLRKSRAGDAAHMDFILGR